MSNCALKSTECNMFCSFQNISSYCFDCPAMMCNQCKTSMHKKPGFNNHQIMDFKNTNLNWNSEQLIASIIDDKTLAINVYNEVSRDSNNITREEICTPIISEDPSDSWICDKCTYMNQLSAKRCNMCCHIRIVKDDSQDYELKLHVFRNEILNYFTEFDSGVDVPLENIMYCYTHGRSSNISLKQWHQQYYPNRKSPNIVNAIIAEKGHSVGTNELDRQYNLRVKQENQKFLRFVKNQKTVKELEVSNESIDPSDVNSRNRIPTNLLDKDVTDSELWALMTKEARFSNREIRLLMTELDIYSPDKISTLRTFVNDSELGAYLKDSCPSTVTLRHVKQAITDFQSIDEAANFLQRSCVLCCGEYPMPEMRTFITCGHEFCKTCVFNCFEETIQSKYPCKWQCPNCSDEQFLQIDKAMHFSQLREILSEKKELLNVFETKLLQEQLMKSPNFHWCANEECTNGFEAEGLNKIHCPSCKLYMCVNCNRKWQNEHEERTCQEFELWMLKNDPNLSNLLRNIGIECPECGMRYALAAGGCLHFDCKACGIKFCGGCEQLFVDKCGKPGCQMTNFHGHHPRNCLYFLRDSSPAELELMLKDADYPKLQGKPDKLCQLMITDKQLKDVPCNKEVHGTTGLCETHYKEYLVQFINRYKIDPADFGNSHVLNLMLFQAVLPRLEKQKNETEEQFKERIKKNVKENCLFYIPKGNVEAPQ